MSYIRKTKTIYLIQGYYVPMYGFETVNTEETYRDGLRSLREHRENEKGISFRIRSKREKIEST